MAAKKTTTRPQLVQHVTSGTFSLTKILLPVLIVLLVASSFLIGVLWTKLSYAQKAVQTTATPSTANAAQQPVGPTITLDQVKALFAKDVIKFGDGNRKILFVEVADPSCPYCHVVAGKDPEISKQTGARFQYASDGGSYVPPVVEMKKLVDEGRASFVFIYYPGHSNGEAAATALYCANEQGKFWPVHDKLMTFAGYNLINGTKLKYNPSAVDTGNGYKAVTAIDLSNMANFLSDAGIDAKKLSSCLSSKKYVQRLAEEANLAISMGVQGTPGFFVNTSLFAGAYSWNDMKPVVDAALK